MTVTESVYSHYIETDAGTIEILHTATLGDFLVCILLSVALLYLIVGDVLRIVWRR